MALQNFKVMQGITLKNNTPSIGGEAEILVGNGSPTTNSVSGMTGSMYMDVGSGKIYSKTGSGWQDIGIQYGAGDGLTLDGSNNFNVGAGNGITVAADTVSLASSTAGDGLTFTTGVLAVGAGNGISVAADAVSLASSTGGAGLTFTTGVLAVGAGNGITVNADDVAVASSLAGDGLTYTTGVVAVGAGTGISVAADAVAVDVSFSPTWTGNHIFSNHITMNGVVSAATDVATKGYVDGVAQGLDPKPSVRAASTAAIDLTTGGLLTIDDISLSNDQRVLVKNQAPADKEQNGIYLAHSGAWTRALDFDAWVEIPGAFTFVEEGTLNHDTGWVCSSNIGGTLDTTDIDFVQFSAAGTYTAGNGLALDGTSFSLASSSGGAGLTYTTGVLAVGAGSGITVNADDVALASSVAGDGLTFTTGVLAVGAGNGLSVSADAIALASSVAGDGLTFTTGVVAVGAGNGISVAADAVAVNAGNGLKFATGALTIDTDTATASGVTTISTEINGSNKLSVSNRLVKTGSTTTSVIQGDAEVIDTVTAKRAKWIISAWDTGKRYSSTVECLVDNNTVDYNEFGVLSIGTWSVDLPVFSVTASGGVASLLVDATTPCVIDIIREWLV